MESQDYPGGAAAGDRPRGINFKKIHEDSYNDEDAAKLKKQIQIFYKKDARSANEPWISFPAEYLAIVSDTYRSAIWDDNIKSITITGGDKAMYQEIFSWILASVEQDPAGPAPWPAYDEETPGVFLLYARLISAARALGVPARDFADPIIKKHMFKLAREHLMSWDEVDFYLDAFSGTSETDEKMREVLASSIANGWWKRKFRENAEDADQDDYCILSVLRAEHSQLDADLHKWCADNEARIRAKWAEKDGAKNTGGAGDSYTNNGDGVGDNGIGRIGRAGGVASSKENMTVADSGYDSAGGAAPSIESIGVGADWDDSCAAGNWGDEVNAYEQRRNIIW